MNRSFVWIVALAVICVAASHQTTGQGEKPNTTIPPAVATNYGGGKAVVLQTTTSVGPRQVTLLGDSLTEGTAKFLPLDTPGFHWSVDAKVGRPLTQAKPILTAAAPRSDVFVIGLGTNDCATSVTDKQLENRIVTAISSTDGLPTSFITLGEHGRIASCAKRFNRMVKLIASTIPAMTVLDWQAQVGAHPEWYGSQGDGIHLTPAGYRARAIWLSSQIHA